MLQSFQTGHFAGDPHFSSRQWGFLLAGQAVHRGIRESEARHHTVAIYLYIKLRSQQEALSEAFVESTRDPKLKYLKSTEESLVVQNVAHLVLHTLQI